MNIDLKNNIVAQFSNMGLEAINAQKDTPESLKLAEKVGLFVATLFPWIIEAALRYTLDLIILIVMLPATLIVQPICSKLAEGDDGWESCKKVITFFKGVQRFQAIIGGYLFSHENPFGLIPTIESAALLDTQRQTYPYLDYSWFIQSILSKKTEIGSEEDIPA